ncbi:MAG: hypothetical protein PHF38_05420, partial [Bacteroidales bacterium]|nr:hypothetical protein [Bacteroidales bacterium]
FWPAAKKIAALGNGKIFSVSRLSLTLFLACGQEDSGARQRQNIFNHKLSLTLLFGLRPRR